MDDEAALIKAAARGDEDKAMQLLAVDTNIDCRDWDNNTPLHYAAMKDGESHLRVAELLLKNKASVDAVGFNNNTPLHFAACAGNEAQAALLLRYKACVDAVAMNKGSATATPLHFAAAISGSPGTVDLLLRSNADVNKECNGFTALVLAVDTGHVKVAEMLRAAGAQEPAPALRAQDV
jgi:ankyrin repeat protein